MNKHEARKLVGSLFDSWYSALVRYACRVCGSLEVAEDVVQEAFLALYSELSQGRRIDNVRGWTLCVVRREIVKVHRVNNRLGTCILPLLDGDDFPAPASGSAMGETGEERDLGRLLAVLTRREEEVLMLRLRAFSYRQIAEQIGISLNSVKTLLARGLRKMRAVSGEVGAEGKGAAQLLGNEQSLPKTLQ